MRMETSASIRRAREWLRERLDALREEELTLGTLLEIARELHRETGGEASPRSDVMLQVETFGHTPSWTIVEIVLRWTRADALDAAPCRLRLRFDVPSSPRVREVLVRSADYPHDAAFLTAVLEATELDRDAHAHHLRLELDAAA